MQNICDTELSGQHVRLYRTQYGNGTLAVQAVCPDGQPFATLSVNTSFSENLANIAENAFYFKTWSENAGLLEQCERQGLVRRLTALPTLLCGPFGGEAVPVYLLSGKDGTVGSVAGIAAMRGGG